MFREITITKQAEGHGPKRRWYQSDYFDLYVFYFRHSHRLSRLRTKNCCLPNTRVQLP